MGRNGRAQRSYEAAPLAAQRYALKEYIQGDAFLRRFFDVFLFEDLPASDRDQNSHDYVPNQILARSPGCG